MLEQVTMILVMSITCKSYYTLILFIVHRCLKLIHYPFYRIELGSASPDNLGWLGKKNGANAIFIAEDTSSHQNDFGWMVDLNTGERTRFLTSVYGAEVTGVSKVVYKALYPVAICQLIDRIFFHRLASMSMKDAVS